MESVSTVKCAEQLRICLLQFYQVNGYYPTKLWIESQDFMQLSREPREASRKAPVTIEGPSLGWIFAKMPVPRITVWGVEILPR